ncbi:Protein of unknown function (DUF3060) [Elizabethkingia sp. YR214]|uniref:DUF3060 domain-containing protein n=1 Tax=Elizabethkingia sp. YR214 TaxID=2135667 RepID=UPI000D443E2D|nr:DUF3060 domain-containing protein [Elizabethkingia sp. YR214]PUB33411.1 Protein of unknown function (DUF3060) [Elizabethkingia sp. YR214]
MKKLFFLFFCMLFIGTSATINAQVFGGNSNTSGSVSEKDGNIHIEGVGHQKKFSSDGGVLHIEGTNNTITVSGFLSKVIIEGASNTVYIDKVSSVKIEGAGTKVYYKTSPTKTGRPATNIFGAGSSVIKQ